MGVFDRARAREREKPARRDVVDAVRARVRRKTREIRDEIDDISATQFILFGASILGAFLLGRRARRADARGTDLDTVAELLKQPYMRELGTPSPRKGLRGVLARARRVFGDDDAETRVRAMELTAKTDAVVAELGVSDVEIMIKNEMAAMSVMSDIATLEAKLDASLNGSDWLLDQSVDETPGKFDGGRTLDDATVSPIAAFSSAGDGGTPLSDRSFERTASKLEI